MLFRYFERAAKTSDPPKTALSWGRVDMRTFAKSLIELCTQTRGLIIQEPRLVKLASPTYILGEKLMSLNHSLSDTCRYRELR